MWVWHHTKNEFKKNKRRSTPCFLLTLFPTASYASYSQSDQDWTPQESYRKIYDAGVQNPGAVAAAQERSATEYGYKYAPIAHNDYYNSYYEPAPSNAIHDAPLVKKFKNYFFPSGAQARTDLAAAAAAIQANAPVSVTLFKLFGGRELFQ